MAIKADHRERGSVTLEMVILFPVLLIMLFGAVQAGLWFHTRNIAMTSAQEGARAAAAFEATSSEGEAAAERFATEAGASQPRAVVTRTTTTTTASVTLAAPNLLPGFIPAMPITQSATMPLERIT